MTEQTNDEIWKEPEEVNNDNTSTDTDNTEQEVEEDAKESEETEDKKNAGSDNVEEEKQNEEVEDKPEQTEQEVPTEEVDYKSIVAWKKEHGELPDDFELPEDFDNSEEGYKELMTSHKKKLQDEVMKPFIEFDEQNNGKLTYLLKHGTLEGFNEVTDYSTWNEDEIDDLKARKLLTDQYKSLGWSDDRIEKKLDKLADIDELSEEAKLALPAAQKKSEQFKKEQQKQVELEKKQEEEKRQQFEQDFHKNIDDMDEFLGIKVNKTLKGKVKNNANKTSKKINENWSKYAGVLTLLDELGILDGDTKNLDKIYTKKVTQKVKNNYTTNPFSKRKAKNSRDITITDQNKAFISSLK